MLYVDGKVLMESKVILSYVGKELSKYWINAGAYTLLINVTAAAVTWFRHATLFLGRPNAPQGLSLYGILIKNNRDTGYLTK